MDIARMFVPVQPRFRAMPLPASTSEHPGITDSPDTMPLEAPAAADDLKWGTAPAPLVHLCYDGWLVYEALVARHLIAQGELLSRVSWFDLEAVLKDRLVESYTDDEWLPSELPVSVVMPSDCSHRFVVPIAILLRGYSDHPLKARCHMARITQQRLFRATNEISVPLFYSFDVPFLCTRGDVPYGERFWKVVRDLQVYTGTFHPHQQFIFWTRLILWAEFRYLRRNSQYVLSHMIQFEQKQRSQSGRLVPYQNTEAEWILPWYRWHWYVPLPEFWFTVQVCRGWYVNLPPCVTYLAPRFLHNPSNGLGSLLVTDCTVHVVTFLLREAYD